MGQGDHDLKKSLSAVKRPQEHPSASAYWLLLPKLRELYPGLTLELVLADHHVDIVEEKIDLAVRFGRKPGAGFIASRLVPRRFHVCGSPSISGNEAGQSIRASSRERKPSWHPVVESSNW